MTKKILLLTAFILLLICSNLLGDLREVIITVLPYSGDVHDCYLYLNTYDVYLEKVDETWNGEDIAELRTYAVIYNLAYGNGGIVTFPTIVHIQLDDGDYPNGITWVGGEGYVHYFGYPCWANGLAMLSDNQACLELTSTEIPDPQYRVTISNPFDEAYNCSMILRPGEPNEEILFENETIPAGETDYTFDPYEIYMYEGDEVQVDGNIAGFYPGQEYSVSASGSVQFQLIPHSPYPPVQAEYFVELELSSHDMPDYEFRTTHLSTTGWNWVSFPVMDPDYSDPIEHVLAPILNDLEKVQHERDWIYETTPGNWVNDIGDFRSIDGYKIKMKNNADLEVAGWWEDPETQIPLYAEVDKAPWPPPLGDGNWIGYFIPGSQLWRIAFAQIWDKITFIKADDWSYINGYCMPSSSCTVDCGKLYIVGVYEDCSLIWQGIGQSPADPYIKPQTEVFSYEEEADYMPIFVDSTDAINGINEIGVFLGDECIGASKIEGFPVFIPAYIEDEDSTGSKDYNELTFQVATYGKGGEKSIPAFIYNETQNTFVEEPVILDAKSYAIVRLGTGEGIEFPKEFALYQNYPNPVKGSTTISFSLHRGDTKDTEINIYNIKGQLVRTLTPMTNDQSQTTNVVWDGKDNNGNQLANGIYFYKLISGEKTAVKKMLLMR